MRWWGWWRKLHASHGDDDPPDPPAVAPPSPEPSPLARAARRARWYKAAAHLIRQQSDIAAEEARTSETTSRDCLLWKYAYERRTDEAAALRAALKQLLEELPEG